MEISTYFMYYVIITERGMGKNQCWEKFWGTIGWGLIVVQSELKKL